LDCRRLEHSAGQQNESWGRGFESRWPPHFIRGPAHVLRASPGVSPSSNGPRLDQCACTFNSVATRYPESPAPAIEIVSYPKSRNQPS